MESKDNRSKDKRHKMKSHYRNKSKYCTTSSSSGQVETVRGYVDVADSSDERFMDRNEWIKGGQKGKSTRNFAPELDDLPMEDENNEQMRAGDFKLMSQMPTSMGGHFKFASEKQWEQAENEEFLNNTEASEYFTLNLKLLNVGLQTIPFYKRMDYSASMFSKDQLNIMEKSAEVAEKNFQNVLKEHIENPRIKISSASRKTNSAKSQKTEKLASKTANEEATDELDDLLNMTSDQLSKVSVKSGSSTAVLNSTTPDNKAAVAAASVSAGDNTDIQQWLDNVLDE